MSLKPVETLALIARDAGWNSALLGRKQQRLHHELLHPHVLPSVLAVFGHGAEALRARELSPTRFVVEIYSPDKDAWTIKKELSDAQAALSDACFWCPLPDKTSVIHLWDKARDRRVRDCTEMLRDPFPDITTLAAFWYDTKALDWPENFGASPWEYAGSVASLTFNEPDGPDCSDDYYEVLRRGARSIESEWGCEELIGSLVQRFLGTSYEFYQGELLHKGVPVLDGGFSRRMTDLEREILNKSVFVSQEVYGGALWNALTESDRDTLLATVTTDDQIKMLQSVRESSWSALDSLKQDAVARHLAYWIEEGRVPLFQLSRVFGRAPLHRDLTCRTHGMLSLNTPAAVNPCPVSRMSGARASPGSTSVPQKPNNNMTYTSLLGLD